MNDLIGPRSSAVTELIEIVLAHPEVMADLVEHRRPYLLDQLRFAVRRQFHVFLEDVDDRRPNTGMLHAPHRQRHAVVEPQEELILIQSNPLELLSRRPLADLDRDLFQMLRELLRQLFQRALDELLELRFAHVKRQQTPPAACI